MVQNFSSAIVDIATQNNKPVSSYRVIVSYPTEYEFVKYKEEYTKILPSWQRNSYKNDGEIDKVSFCYYSILNAFSYLSAKTVGVVNSYRGYYKSDNKSAKPDRRSYLGESKEERVEIGIYDEGLDINEALEKVKSKIPAIVADDIKIIGYRKVKSNPRKEKVKCTEKVYDQFNVLIEEGDLIAYPKGGDHNYYYVCKDEVVENTPQFVKLKNGDMTKANKVIVIKAKNPDKKLSF